MKLGLVLGGALSAALVGALALATNSAAAEGHAPAGSRGVVTPAGVQQGTVVPEEPQHNWPRIADGGIEAGDQVGDYLVYGGSFKTIDQPDGSTLKQSYIVAFNVDTGAVLQTFLPTFNDVVFSIEAGDAPDTVFVGGKFTTVNGQPANHLVKLDLTTGQPVAGFQVNTSGVVKTMTRYGDRLWIGGTFAKVNSKPRSNLAEISASTGAAAASFTIGVTGKRNSGCRADRYCTTLSGPIVRSLRVTPDGKTLIVMHRGDLVGGLTRWGAAEIDVSGATPMVTPWRTDLWDSSKTGGRQEFVGIVEGDMSPDGTMFAMTLILGNYPPWHDTVVAFPVQGTAPVQPLWVTQNFDSNYGLAISDAAVYVGGHFCWTESSQSIDSPFYWPGSTGNQYSWQQTSGSVFQPRTTYRYHLAALDPATGFALPWDPRSNNSGNGVKFLRVVPRGLMLGHDGSRVHKVLVGRSAFFDLTQPDG